LGRFEVVKEPTRPVPGGAGHQIDNKVVKQLYLFFTFSLPKIVFAGGKVPEQTTNEVTDEMTKVDQR
jgi:hypothetical protein